MRKIHKIWGWLTGNDYVLITNKFGHQGFIRKVIYSSTGSYVLLKKNNIVFLDDDLWSVEYIWKNEE